MNKSRAPAEGGGPSGRVVAVLSRILGSDNARFLREFVRDPIQTAAIAPSSPALAEAMAAVVPSDGHPTVVELGPGTGAIIAAIQRRLGGRGRHLAIERQPRWASLLQQRFPDVDVIHGDVADLPAILTEHDADPADAVVSGLPWAAYRGQLVVDLAGALASCGVFSQFAYSWSRWAPPARAELAALRRHFSDVVISAPIRRNLPPAIVYYARGPVDRSRQEGG